MRSRRGEIAINIPGIELKKKLLKKLFAVCSSVHFEIDRNAASQPLLEYTQPEQSRIIVLLLRYAVTRHSPMLCRVHPMPHLPLSLHTPQRSFLADEQFDGFWKEKEVISMDYMENRDKHCSARLYISPRDLQENKSVKCIPLSTPLLYSKTVVYRGIPISRILIPKHSVVLVTTVWL